MAVTLPLEVCVSDLPSRLSFAANEAQPCLSLNVCLKVPVQDLVTALVNFQKNQEALIADASKAQLKAEPKAPQPPGLLPPPSAARPHESAAAAAANTDSIAGPPGVPAPHVHPVSNVAVNAMAAAPEASMASAAPTPAVASGAAATATTAERGPPKDGPHEATWGDCIAVLQPWSEDYKNKNRWNSTPQKKAKALQLLKDLMLNENEEPALDAAVINKPPGEFQVMPNPPPANPPRAPPPARPDPAVAQIAASLAASPGTSAPQGLPAPLPPHGSGTAPLARGGHPEPAQEPGVGDAYEPESEEAANGQSAAPLNLPPQEAPPPPPGIANGSPADNPPPGLAAGAPPGLPAPVGPQSASAGHGAPQPGAHGQSPQSKQECKQQ